MKKIYTLFSFIATSILMAQAPLLVEQFNYTAGSDLAANGWNVHSGTAAPILVSSAGLSFTGYSASGVGNAALVNNTGIDVNKPFSANVETGSVYASFLVNVTENTPLGYFFHLGTYSNTTTPVYTALSTAFRARTYIVPGTNTATQFKLGLSFNATTAQGQTADLTIGQTYLVVVKYTFVTGALNDTVSLFVYSAGDTIPTTEPATPTLGPFATADATADAVMLQAAVLRQYDATQRITVDGIVVRTNWDLTSSLSTNEFLSNNNISLYPNPTSNGNVNINVEGKKQIQLYDTSGREVLHVTTNENNFMVDGINSGIYMVKVTADNSTKVAKLIIK